MELWTEMRTALFLGRLGTVKAAAEAMGVHRATVSRHVDALEDMLGTRLFTRHKGGYSLTDDGLAMMEAAENAEALFQGFVTDLIGTSGELTGQLRLSSLSRAASLIAPAIREFSRRHPKVTIKYDSLTDLAKVERGEAHVAIRSGQKPNNPDYVVIPFKTFTVGLYGTRSYLEAYGTPRTHDDLTTHRFIGRSNQDSKEDLERRIHDALPKTGVVLETHDPTVVLHGVLEGLGLGILSNLDAQQWPELVEVLPQRHPLTANLWIVTHVDVHRALIVQEFIAALKQFSPHLD